MRKTKFQLVVIAASLLLSVAAIVLIWPRISRSYAPLQISIEFTGQKNAVSQSAGAFLYGLYSEQDIKIDIDTISHEKALVRNRLGFVYSGQEPARLVLDIPASSIKDYPEGLELRFKAEVHSGVVLISENGGIARRVDLYQETMRSSQPYCSYKIAYSGSIHPLSRLIIITSLAFLCFFAVCVTFAALSAKFGLKFICTSLFALMFAASAGSRLQIIYTFTNIVNYMIVIAYALLFSSLFKQRLERTIPFAFFFIGLMLYLGAIFDFLFAAYVTIAGFGLLLFLGMLSAHLPHFRTKAPDFLKPDKTCLSSVGLIVFTLSYFTFSIIARNWRPYRWDEFSFWAAAAKYLHQTNQLYTLGAQGMNTLGISWYPPLAPLMQYFFSGLYGKGTIIEASWLFATVAWIQACMLPLFENVQNTDKFKLICTCLAYWALPMLFFTRYLTYPMTIYCDPLLGAVLGYALMTVQSMFTEKSGEKNNRRFATAAAAMAVMVCPLIKEFGIVCSAAVIIAAGTAMIASSGIFIKRHRHAADESNGQLKLGALSNKGLTISLLVLIAVLIVSLFAAWWSWQVHLGLAFGSGAGNPHLKSESALSTLLSVFQGTDNTYREQVVANFLSSIWQLPPHSTLFWIPKLAHWLLLFVALSVLILVLLPREKRVVFTGYSAGITIGTAVYLFALCAAYVLMFSEKEALELASLSRYASSMYLGTLSALICYLLGVELQGKTAEVTLLRRASLGIVLLLLFVSMTDWTSLNDVQKMSLDKSLHYDRQKQNEARLDSCQSIEAGSRVFVIDQNPQENNYFYLRYYYPDFIYNLRSMSILTPGHENWSIPAPPDINLLRHEISGYDYVFLSNTDKFLMNTYGTLFENGGVESYVLYKVTKAAGELRLEVVK